MNTKLKSKPFAMITDTSKENIFNYTHFKPLTRILNSLSLTFVVGERFFCEAVRTHQPCQDDKLYFEIREFIKQEAQHSMAHRSLNNILATTYGLNLQEAEISASDKLNSLGISDQEKLMTTVCLEDLTAFGGLLYIAGGKYLFKKNLQTSRLWEEHAKEEVQHHFLAKEVYRNCYGKNNFKMFLHFFKTLGKLISQVVSNYRMLKRIEKEI